MSTQEIEEFIKSYNQECLKNGDRLSADYMKDGTIDFSLSIDGLRGYCHYYLWYNPDENMVINVGIMFDVSTSFTVPFYRVYDLTINLREIKDILDTNMDYFSKFDKDDYPNIIKEEDDENEISFVLQVKNDILRLYKDSDNKIRYSCRKDVKDFISLNTVINNLLKKHDMLSFKLSKKNISHIRAELNKIREETMHEMDNLIKERFEEVFSYCLDKLEERIREK